MCDVCADTQAACAGIKSEMARDVQGNILFQNISCCVADEQPPPSPISMTLGGDEVACNFPFVHEGKEYTSCKIESYESSWKLDLDYWCSTNIGKRTCSLAKSRGPVDPIDCSPGDETVRYVSNWPYPYKFPPPIEFQRTSQAECNEQCGKGILVCCYGLSNT